jgi:hypothetical protein
MLRQSEFGSREQAFFSTATSRFTRGAGRNRGHASLKTTIMNFAEVHAHPQPSRINVRGSSPQKETFISSPEYRPRNAVWKSLSAMHPLPCLPILLFCCALWIGLSNSVASPPATLASSALDRHSSTPQETDSNLKQRQIAFLNRIRKADPQHLTIERALFNDKNELGLILCQEPLTIS